MTHRITTSFCLMVLMIPLAACTAEQVTGSVGKSMQGLCRNTPEKCTVYDETGKAE